MYKIICQIDMIVLSILLKPLFSLFYLLSSFSLSLFLFIKYQKARSKKINYLAGNPSNSPLVGGLATPVVGDT